MTAARPTTASRKAPVTRPVGAKVPEDHRSPKEDLTGPKDVVISWPVTRDPDVEVHEYTVDGEALNDAELLEYFTDENFVGGLRQMLGRADWARYKENARDAAGRVTATDASEFLKHVLTEVKRGNS